MMRTAWDDVIEMAENSDMSDPDRGEDLADRIHDEFAIPHSLGRRLAWAAFAELGERDA